MARPRGFAVGICALILLFATGLCADLARAVTDQPSRRTVTSASASLSPAAATEAFGLDLLGAEPGNVVLAPNSVATALAMVGTGATGRTATQIAEALHLGGSSDFDAVGELQRTIAGEQASVGEGHPSAPTLKSANGVFLQQGFPIEPAFLGGLQEHFGATPEALDFLGDSTGSLSAINAWVRDRTDGIIPELLVDLPAETRLVLTNAVYLKATWRHRFALADTATAPFYGSTGRTPVEFMHQTELLRYASGPGYKAVELPYRASTLSLLVVLPMGKNVAGLERNLGAGGFGRMADNLRHQTIRLSLPRFHVTTHASLNGPLKALGMTDAFSESAQFSRITPAGNLKIAFVEHAADLSVDEAGTVGAAATAVGVVKKSKGPLAREAVEFNANRPFLFFVRDKSTGAVLFAGRLTDPASAGAGVAPGYAGRSR